MNDIINKITSYQIFNYLLPGILFVLAIEKTTSYSLSQENIFIAAFLYYFIGLTISRFGSLVLEPIFKKIKLISHSEYTDFVSASQNDSKIDTLLEVTNMYRTLSSAFVLIIGVKVYELLAYQLPMLRKWDIVILIASLLLIFLWSYIKQTRYLSKRVNVK